MKSKKAKNILLFVFSSLVLGLYVYKNITIQNTLSTSFVFPAPKLASQNQKCDLLETLEYVDYKQSDWEVNNKFGIYIYAENKDFFELAQTLVNSNGGDWGYALVPFNVNDRDFGKWNRAFEQMRNKHLIPIIQLWAIDPDDYYDQTKDAAIFLNQFIWPIKPRYISAYNEMNDAKFWGGEVNPEQYAEVLDATIQLFKAVNDNFFIMNGAFNVSAPTDSSLGTLDSFTYMRRMDAKVPGIFSGLDGWASHPYPQPNFSGNPDASGRWSIRAYEDELDFLKNELGLKKDLPVFITETGWAHAEGDSYNSSFLPSATVSKYFEKAFENVWLPDDRVRAVTPFTIRYDAPFDHFSWVNKDNVPYQQFDAIKNLDKVKGTPPVFQISRISTC